MATLNKTPMKYKSDKNGTEINGDPDDVKAHVWYEQVIKSIKLLRWFIPLGLTLIPQVNKMISPLWTWFLSLFSGQELNLIFMVEIKV